MKIELTVNGRRHEAADVEPRLLLVHYLRDSLGLTGTHIGCETSLCGACTVVLDGKVVKSCTVLAVQADGGSVTTIEGLAASDASLHPVQRAFWECHGLQCGFCTPGMILAAKDLLERVADPDEDRIRHALDGNLCRCTGYQHIVDAVRLAAREAQGSLERGGRWHEVRPANVVPAVGGGAPGRGEGVLDRGAPPTEGGSR